MAGTMAGHDGGEVNAKGRQYYMRNKRRAIVHYRRRGHSDCPISTSQAEGCVAAAFRLKGHCNTQKYSIIYSNPDQIQHCGSSQSSARWVHFDHSSDMVLNQPALPRAQWHAEVDKMQTAYKAPDDPNDTDAILGYLASVKGVK
jgi:hypothetical protein